MQTAIGDSAVESQRNLRAAFGIGIKDTRLRSHHEPVGSCLANPVYIVVELAGDILRSFAAQFLKHFGGKAVGQFEVFGKAGGTNPAEGSETVVEEQRTHYVLHVGRISETAVFLGNVGTRPRRFKQEGVAIVEEIHACGRQLVYCIDLAAQRLLHMAAEFLGLLSHHALGLFEGQPGRIVASCPRIVQRSLVRTQIDIHTFGGKLLPQIHHIALICQRNGLSGLPGGGGTGKKSVEIGVHLVDPALATTFLHSFRVNFGHDCDHTGYIAGLRLCSAHAAEACCDKQHTRQRTVGTAGAAASGIEHGDGGSVHNALRTYVHVGACCHLPVLAHAKRIEALVVIGLGVVGNHHTVGHNHPRRPRR